MSGAAIKRLILAGIVGLLVAMPALGSVAGATVSQDVPSAVAAGLQYLAQHQQADGSISGFGGESEWSVEALAAGGQSAAAFAHGGASLLDFVKTDTPGPTAAATTIERNMIAVAAAGGNEANFSGTDYHSRLAAQHVAGQIGDPTLLNDDIFGIIAIDAAHDTQLQGEAQDGLNYLLAHQGTDGGFSYTTASCDFCGSDTSDTAAALVALFAAQDSGLTNTSLSAAQTAARAYVLGNQQSDGGFSADAFSPSDGDSTAWALIALNALGDSAGSPAAAARTWLLQNQNADGGFSYGAYGTTDSDTYTTAHAVIALMGTTWLLRPAPIVGTTGQPSGTTTSSQPTAGTGGTVTTASSTASTVHVAGSTSGDNTVQAVPQTDPAIDNTDQTAQVKGASTILQSGNDNQTTAPAAAKTTKTHHDYSLYTVIVLGLAALIWFVLESRHKQKV